MVDPLAGDVGAPRPHARPGRRVGAHKWDALTYFMTGLAVTLALVCAKTLLERTSAGEWVERETRAHLFALMWPFRDDEAVPVVLDMDPADMGRPAGPDGRPTPTSRAVLRQMLQALAPLSPRAVGIDVDFAGDSQGFIGDDDATFFEFCLDFDRRIPLRLGVYRSIPRHDGRWLEVDRYRRLAASLFVRDSESGLLPVAVKADNTAPALLNLGAALATSVRTRAWDPLSLGSEGGWLRRFAFEELVERRLELDPSDLVIQTREAPVNYALVHQIARETIPDVPPADLARFASRIRGRIVLIGRMDGAPDRFVIPGDTHASQAGVLLHAAQAYTLTSDPVYEFSTAFRTLLDLALPVAIMTVVIAVRRRSARMSEARAHVLERRVILGAAVLVCTCAITLLVLWHIFWLDFVLVMLFLALHRHVEAWAHGVLGGRQRGHA